MRAIDLFCGAGGMTSGLVARGFEVVGAVDSWDVAIGSHRRNFDHPVIQSDIAELDAATLLAELDVDPAMVIDLVVGGPPCQGFSIQRIGPDHDERNHLVLEFARLTMDLAPRYVLMENVKGLLGRRGAPLLRECLRLLAEGGYEASVDVVDAADFGVPQRRLRAILSSWRNGEAPLERPSAIPPTTHSTVWDAIGDLPRPPSTGHMSPDPLHVESRMSKLNKQRLALIPAGGGFEDLPPHMRVACHRNGAAKIGHRNVYGRLAPDKPAATITARFDSFTRGKFAHPFEDRNITLREGARLQTFPDDFEFIGNREQVAAQIGNAVPPQLAAVLADSVARRIRGLPRPYCSGQQNLF